MKSKEIISIIERKYPENAALDFDNVGLQVGRSDKEVKKIYLALDATDEVIKQAVSQGADMLITHHPLIFTPLKRVLWEDFIGRRISCLIQQDISYYAMHTNYDVLGMAELSGNLFELEDSVVLEETYYEQEVPQGIGRAGRLKRPMNLLECCEYVKEKLQVKQVKVFGDTTDTDRTYQKLAISPGSGKGMADAAIEKGADILVTGDIDHHEGIDAIAKGIAVIDAGHYGTEYIFMEDVKHFLQEKTPEIEIITAAFSEPFQII